MLGSKKITADIKKSQDISYSAIELVENRSPFILIRIIKSLTKSNSQFCLYHYCHHHQGKPTVQIPLILTIRPYRSVFLESPLDSIQWLHKMIECEFLQISQHWYVHVSESIGELCLWVHLCLSSTSSVAREIGGK